MYTLRPPAPALRPFVEHYWFVTDADGPVDVRVDAYVDGRADLVFNHGAPYERTVIGGPRATLGSSNLDAQRLVPIRIAQKGRVRTAGVRFHLGGLAPFAQVPLRPFTGLTPAPSEVLGPSIDALDAALATLDPDAAAAALDAWFLGALQTSEAHTTFATALARLVEAKGAVSVADLASGVATSPRQLERLFARFLGIPPRTTGRIARFQVALRALMRDPGVPLADVAHAAGYFDQAHFVREFRSMTGGVPRGYRGYYPPRGPSDFAPNVVAFVQDAGDDAG
ncbi:MAG: AraC family transcriptional regulator [Alphaproteobacteria bacterium]|nr:AraC family transcriptional regulator [Alphaproteobacteria bacterium]